MAVLTHSKAIRAWKTEEQIFLQVPVNCSSRVSMQGEHHDLQVLALFETWQMALTFLFVILKQFIATPEN